MRHQQILTKLAAGVLVRALDEDLAACVGWQMLGGRLTHREVELAVPPLILARWRCLLDAGDADPVTTDKVWVALATLLHRYGLSDPGVTAKALAAIDDLNRGVVLSDAFARQSPAIRELLRSAPVPLTRRPRQPRTVSMLRPGDLLSVQMGEHFHAAFVLEIAGSGDCPVLAFYAGRFDRPPAVARLAGRPAARHRHWARFGVHGLTYLPDPARQFVALAAGHPDPPGRASPRPGEAPDPMSEGSFILTDMFRLQHDLAKLYGDATVEDGR